MILLSHTPSITNKNRWNSTFDMLDRLLQLRPAVHAVCRIEESLKQHALSDEDWDLITELRTILSIFVKATEHLSGSSYPTLFTQLPYFVYLASRLEKVVDDLKIHHAKSDLLQAVSQAWHKLNQYHLQTTSSQSIATILDPRCKLQTFRYLAWKDEWIAEAHKSFIQIYNQQYLSQPNCPEIPGDRLPEYEEQEVDDYTQMAFGPDGNNEQLRVDSEVDLYLGEPIVARKVQSQTYFKSILIIL